MLQELIRSYTDKWKAQGTWTSPNVLEALTWMATEVGEALDTRLRQDSKWFRNNPQPAPAYEEVAEEIFDAILMGCIALDLLHLDLMEVAHQKLAKMDERRRPNGYRHEDDAGGS